MKTDAELAQVAEDLHAGRLFSDRHCDSVEEFRSSFLVIAFMKPEVLEEFTERAGFVYEYLCQAGPRSVNGRPIFFSCQSLDHDETKRMFKFYQKIKDAVSAAKQP